MEDESLVPGPYYSLEESIVAYRVDEEGRVLINKTEIAAGTTIVLVSTHKDYVITFKTLTEDDSTYAYVLSDRAAGLANEFKLISSPLDLLGRAAVDD